ncbi:class I SAM-dependent methyltransferase [Rhizobium binxianense]
MNDVTEDPLYRDPALARFYDAANGWAADFDYCMALAGNARSVLDLGCGTGELTATLADGRIVTGVDPAGAMLDIARQRPGGEKVEWVQADARSVRLGKRFDLVVLTGHVFQVFLTEEDQRAVLATIAAHLAPGGRFILDSRNPAYQGPKDVRQGRSRQLDHAEFGAVEAWDTSFYDEKSGVLSYSNGYRVLATGQSFEASAKIRYTSRDMLARMIGEAGLAVDGWLGDWSGSAFEEGSREIIPLGRLA